MYSLPTLYACVNIKGYVRHNNKTRFAEEYKLKNKYNANSREEERPWRTIASARGPILSRGESEPTVKRMWGS